MSVDKFGRRSNRKRPERGPKGDGFKLTLEGDYDIQNKRLRYLNDPVESQDCVNLITLQNGLLNCMQLSGQKTDFDAQKKRVANAKDPMEDTDLVTKRYLHSHTPDEKETSWSFRNKRLSNVANPVDDGEAVNLDYIKNSTILKDRNNLYDAKHSVITNLAPPVGKSDAINKAYFENNALVLKYGEEWDFSNKRIINVKDPEGEPKAPVNFEFLERHALCRDNNNDRPTWDARGLTVSHAGLPIDGGDVVTKMFLQHTLSYLSYEIYKQIMCLKNKDSTVYPFDSWNSEVFITPWVQLFRKGV